MKIARLAWRRFRLPLRRPFQAANAAMTHREGLLLRLTTDSGIAGIGEASPHPAAGWGAIRELKDAMVTAAPALIGDDLECLPPPGVPSALTAALDIAACDALARERGVSVAGLLRDHPRARVPVNATIATGDAVRQAAWAREAGFSCVKLKVGMAPGGEAARQRVSEVRAALGPDVVLRLDANGAWEPAEAIEAIRAFEEFNVELVEQPVAPGRLTEMARVREAVSVQIAADEDVTDITSARRVLEARAADALVLKIGVLGGLRVARRIAEMAEEAGASVIVTTTIDAGVATAAALHLAATLPAGGPAHGLATGDLLSADIITAPLPVREGWIQLPERPGLGVELDEEALAAYCGPETELH